MTLTSLRDSGGTSRGGVNTTAVSIASVVSVQSDTTPPSFVSDTANPNSGVVGAGQTVVFTLGTSEPVTVTGTPELGLNDGGVAQYDPTGSTTTSLAFIYTVADGQNTSALAVTEVVLPTGATIQDENGNNAVLSGAYASFPGLQVVTDAPCYCPGTLILTNRGEKPVEILAIGDTVMTASGEHCPIRWIGRRSYDGRFIAGNHLMLPVTIRAGALADGVPHTDLTVSPGHAMWVDGQLVPAWRLINGVSITQADAVEHVAYFHVELHRHDVLLANGAPAESFLDETGFRGQFHNAADFHRDYPDASPLAPMQARLEDGFALQCIRERLAARARVHQSVEPAGELRGYIDQAGPARICGWAQDMDIPEEPVALEIRVGGVPVLSVLANAYRADLRRAGLGSGCHAFDVALPPGVGGVITVQRVMDGALLRVADASARSEQRQAA